MFSADKTPYTPSPDKRFLVSPDAISRQRIEIIKELHHELARELPFTFACSVWGSLAKGKPLTADTAHTSDIDLTLFFDIDELQAHFPRFIELHPEMDAYYQRAKQGPQYAVSQHAPARFAPSPEWLTAREYVLQRTLHRLRNAGASIPVARFEEDPNWYGHLEPAPIGIKGP